MKRLATGRPQKLEKLEGFEEDVEKVRNWLANKSRAVVLSGAGIR